MRAGIAFLYSFYFGSPYSHSPKMFTALPATQSSSGHLSEQNAYLYSNNITNVSPLIQNAYHPLENFSFYKDIL